METRKATKRKNEKNFFLTFKTITTKGEYDMNIYSLLLHIINLVLLFTILKVIIYATKRIITKVKHYFNTQ